MDISDIYIRSDVSIQLWSLTFGLLSKQHTFPTPLCHTHKRICKLKNELVAILETDWLYCAWQSRQEKILGTYVCLETGRVVCGCEGRQTRPFPTDTYFDKPKVANWF